VPGTPCAAVNAAGLDRLRAAGLGDFIRHRVGHAMGVQGHEGPWLAPGDATPVAAGMVFSNEPGIYRPGVDGYRTIDSMIVGDRVWRSPRPSRRASRGTRACSNPDEVHPVTRTPPDRLLRALAGRLHDEDVSIRTKMLEAAAKLDDVIAMGRGDPDLHTPAHIVEAAKRAIDANEHHYTHPTGMPRCARRSPRTLAREYGLDYTLDEVVVTAGVQESVMLCMLALVDPGDEVLITSPRFTTYDTAVQLCGGVPVPCPPTRRTASR
jgi:hypothetical protein